MKNLTCHLLGLVDEKDIIQRLLQAETQTRELKAHLIHNYKYAIEGLRRLGQDRLTGSALILEITYLGGKPAIEPIAISDGLSIESIKSLHADLLRSYDKKLEFPPSRKID